NNARLRLLRLSEAAEKLRQQATKSLRVGKDNEARELLLQKKKILQAMEKSKIRAHLLDELASKLNEAISVKETHLIGKVASDLEFGREELSSTIHVVSPLQDTAEIMDADEKSRQSDVAVCVNIDSQLDCDFVGEIEADEKSCDSVASDDISRWIESEIPSSLDGISSYNHFLERLDSQLSKIETDLTSYVRLISMVLEEKETTSNVKLQQVKEILHKVLDTRHSFLFTDNSSHFMLQVF
ncbi:hypothetical protein V2J09_001734, partial [Rumex salicifolius]